MSKILYRIIFYSFLLIKQGEDEKTVKDWAQLLAASVSVFEDLKVEKLKEVLSFQKSEVVGWNWRGKIKKEAWLGYRFLQPIL
jgi:hypothetical protein